MSENQLSRMTMLQGHKREASGDLAAGVDGDTCEGMEHAQVTGMHEAIQDAVQEAVHEHLEVDTSAYFPCPFLCSNWPPRMAAQLLFTPCACDGSMSLAEEEGLGCMQGIFMEQSQGTHDNALHDKSVEVWLQGVHGAVQDAVTEAVQAAVDEGMKFDVRANLYTLIAITGAAPARHLISTFHPLNEEPGLDRAAHVLQAWCCTGGASGPPGELHSLPPPLHACVLACMLACMQFCTAVLPMHERKLSSPAARAGTTSLDSACRASWARCSRGWAS